MTSDKTSASRYQKNIWVQHSFLSTDCPDASRSFFLYRWNESRVKERVCFDDCFSSICTLSWWWFDSDLFEKNKEKRAEFIINLFFLSSRFVMSTSPFRLSFSANAETSRESNDLQIYFKGERGLTQTSIISLINGFNEKNVELFDVGNVKKNERILSFFFLWWKRTKLVDRRSFTNRRKSWTMENRKSSIRTKTW